MVRRFKVWQAMCPGIGIRGCVVVTGSIGKSIGLHTDTDIAFSNRCNGCRVGGITAGENGECPVGDGDSTLSKVLGHLARGEGHRHCGTVGSSIGNIASG